MNLFMLLYLPLLEVRRIIAREYDKIKIFFAYISKMNLIDDQPRNLRGKVYFNEVRKVLGLIPIYLYKNLIPRIE